MRTRYAGILVLALALGPACKGDKSQKNDEAAQTGPETPKKITAEDVTRAANRAFTKLSPDQIRHDVDIEGGDKKKGWVPAEFKSGRGRWRDAGAYVDGVPVGMFWFGELPAKLEPVWLEEIEGLDFRPGDPGPHEKIVHVRRYRFSDYFAAAGVDLSKMKEMHVYGPNNQVLILDREEFNRVKDYFYFRFGLATSGKPIAVIPKDLGSNFDRLMGVAVYIDKKPPKMTDKGLVLNGERVMGIIPYYGAPVRGGIRVYKDDRLATVLKRNKMDRSLATDTGDGAEWKVLEVLAKQGVETDDIVQLEVIYDEERTERFGKDELASMTFRTSSQGRGEITLSVNDTPAHALAFYTKPLPTRVAKGPVDEIP